MDGYCQSPYQESRRADGDGLQEGPLLRGRILWQPTGPHGPGSQRGLSPHGGDHNPADQESLSQIEIEWKPNKLFVHNSIPNKTWHSYMSHEERIVLSIFFVQPDLIIDSRYPMYLLDVDPKYYENIL